MTRSANTSRGCLVSQLPAVINRAGSTAATHAYAVPALIDAAGDRAALRFLEFLAALRWRLIDSAITAIENARPGNACHGQPPYAAAFHLIEQPIDGTCPYGASPVAAMARIASNNSRRAPGGGGDVRPSSRRPRYFSRRCES